MVQFVLFGEEHLMGLSGGVQLIRIIGNRKRRKKMVNDKPLFLEDNRGMFCFWLIFVEVL